LWALARDGDGGEHIEEENNDQFSHVFSEGSAASQIARERATWLAMSDKELEITLCQGYLRFDLDEQLAGAKAPEDDRERPNALFRFAHPCLKGMGHQAVLFHGSPTQMVSYARSKSRHSVRPATTVAVQISSETALVEQQKPRRFTGGLICEHN
jgi:hypothetical protein